MPNPEDRAMDQFQDRISEMGDSVIPTSDAGSTKAPESAYDALSGFIHATKGKPHQIPSYEKLQNIFGYHKPKNDQAKRYEAIRAACLSCAALCVDITPVTPEQTLALGKLREAMFLFNASIACNE